MIYDHDTFLWDSNGNWHFCKFFIHLHTVVGKLTCDAFPEEVPKELDSGLVFHAKPMLCQENDIVFEPKYK